MIGIILLENWEQSIFLSFLPESRVLFQGQWSRLQRTVDFDVNGNDITRNDVRWNDVGSRMENSRFRCRTEIESRLDRISRSRPATSNRDEKQEFFSRKEFVQNSWNSERTRFAFSFVKIRFFERRKFLRKSETRDAYRRLRNSSFDAILWRTFEKWVWHIIFSHQLNSLILFNTG